MIILEGVVCGAVSLQYCYTQRRCFCYLAFFFHYSSAPEPVIYTVCVQLSNTKASTVGRLHQQLPLCYHRVLSILFHYLLFIAQWVFLPPFILPAICNKLDQADVNGVEEILFGCEENKWNETKKIMLRVIQIKRTN